MIWHKSFDGKRIQAGPAPPDFQAGRKYPLILNIHGGRTPRTDTRSTTSFNGWPRRTSCFTPTRAAARPTGRTSATSFNTRTGDDYKDLMAGVDDANRARMG